MSIALLENLTPEQVQDIVAAMIVDGVNFTHSYDDTTNQLTFTGIAATLDTDGALTANSDAKLATQKAIVTYVATKLAGLSWKQAVRCASTVTKTLATQCSNGQVIDGVTLVTGDRILLKNQTTGSENGIYTVNASGSPTRATDADAGSELVNASCYISEGTVNADTQWVVTTNAPITIGTTALTISQFTAGSGVTIDTDGTMAANSDAVVASQKATVTYVQNQVNTRTMKAVVRVASTANGTLATAFANGQTLDGVSLVTGDRILLKNQTTQSENGIYTVNASGAPTRAADADTGAKLVSAVVVVSEGANGADTLWICGTNAPITLGSSSIGFAFSGGAGILAAGLNLSDLTNPTVARGNLGLGSAAVASLDTDGTAAANSDTAVASQKAMVSYVGTRLNALGWKPVVRVATTANGALATAYANGQTVDGVTLATGDRILLKNQTTGADNGIYTVNASGAPTRAVDADAGAELISLVVRVSEGTANADTEWYSTNDATVTVGTTAIVFVQSSTSGIKSNLTASANPTTTDDSAAGYSAGSTWYNTANETRWYCADATASAAIWLKLAIDTHKTLITGRFYGRVKGVTRATAALALGDAFYALLYELKEAISIDRLVGMVGTGVASSNIKMAMYSIAGSTWTRRASTAACDCSSSTTVVTGTLNEGASVALTPGLYGIGCITDPAAIANLVVANSSSIALAEDVGAISFDKLVGSTANNIGYAKVSTGLYAAGPSSSMDMSSSGTVAAVNCPIIGFRVA